MEFEPKIIFEDNQILVVIKPYNLAVQADSSSDPDLLTLLKNYIKERDDKKGNVFLGLVHRLDRPTGGVMVFAKTSKAAARLSAQLKSNTMHKNYLCVVNGRPQIVEDRLVCYLKKDEKTNTVNIAPKLEFGSKEAILDYKIIESKDKLSLIEVSLVTGRSHQIRAQMSFQNHTPLYGDFKYGDKEHGGSLALWAYQLKLIHPVSKQAMTFKVAPDYSNVAFTKFETTISQLIK